MLFEIILALFLGILAGTFTGLMPGIHINLVGVLLISSISFFLSFASPFILVIFIVSMSITHTFIDFIPSIFLGAPNEDTVLSIMPGQEMLLQGKGHEAVFLTLIGCLIGLFLLIFLVPLFIYTLPNIYPFFQKMMFWILIWACIFLILKENTNKVLALIIFILAGFLGLSTLNLPIKQPLLPLLTGLFGSSSLIYSLSQKTKLPEQKIEKIIINKKELIKPALASLFSSPLCSFLPGLGSSQAAIIGSGIIGKLSRKQFLMLLGSVNILVMSLSFVVLYLIQKSRTGSAYAINEIMLLSLENIFYILLIILITSVIVFFLGLKISKIFIKNINKINYSKISLAVLFLLSIIVLIFSGLLGFLVFLVSTCLGLTCNYLNIRKGLLMGCLLVPTMIFYLPFLS
ncbi:MAG: tripartite tricarboxylate transporter permease [Nanoarchaeota archaeon]|nr:tripartite tricarboxylate transporter permease [Nanoarchaeota archaeon]